MNPNPTYNNVRALLADFMEASDHTQDVDSLMDLVAEDIVALVTPPNGTFPILLSDDEEGTINVNVTDEGVIFDLILDGDVFDTWGQTAQEIADGFFV